MRVKDVRVRTRSEVLCELLAGSWRQNPPPAAVLSTELEDVVPVLHGSGAAGLAWQRIRGSALADLPAADGLKQAYRLQVLRNAALEQEIQEIFALLQSAGIEALLIKGWSVARTYSDAGLRPYGDIDLVVRASQRTAAEQLLAGRDLVDLDHGELHDLDERAVSGLFESSQVVDRIRFPGPEDHLRLICLHFLRHGGWRPLWLCDIAAALETQPPNFNWDRCLEGGVSTSRAQRKAQFKAKTQARGIACCVTLAHELLGASVSSTTPAMRRFGGRLPGWFTRAVRGQWDHAHYQEHEVPDAIADSLWRLPDSLRQRWPDPISATLLTGAPFNEAPRVLFQVGYYGFLARRYMSRLRVKLS
jgi:hypothetical protein